MHPLLPLSEKKMEILRYLYENAGTHLRAIAAALRIHPYQVKQIIDAGAANGIIEQRRAGRTVLLTLSSTWGWRSQLIHLIEEYKQHTTNRALSQLIGQLRQQFGEDRDILSCCIFGSYARGAQTRKSDVDVLFVIGQKTAARRIVGKLSQIGSLLGLTISPIIVTEAEWKAMVKRGEPTTSTLQVPAQRIIVLGIEHFLRELPIGK